MTDLNKQEIDKICAFHPEASQHLADMTFGDDLEKRDKWFKLFQENPVFWDDRKFELLDDSRKIAYQRIQTVAKNDMFSIYDFENDPINLFTAHEMLGMSNGSLATKFTVQNNLFGGTLMALSTD